MSKRKPKQITRERAATMLERAVEGSRRLGMDDVADRYEDMSVDDYADEKGLRLINPASLFKANKPKKRSTKAMATTTTDTRTKQDLITENDALLSLLDEVWEQHAKCGDKSTKAELLEASNDTCDSLHEYDSDRFPFDDDGADEDQDEDEDE
jgi:hypothetical protein